MQAGRSMEWFTILVRIIKRATNHVAYIVGYRPINASEKSKTSEKSVVTAGAARVFDFITVDQNLVFFRAYFGILELLLSWADAPTAFIFVSACALRTLSGAMRCAVSPHPRV